MISERDRLLDKARGCHDLAATAVTAEGRQILDEIASRYEKEAAAASVRQAPRPALFA